jgi:lysophospholipase L1-like esterase
MKKIIISVIVTLSIISCTKEMPKPRPIPMEGPEQVHFLTAGPVAVLAGNSQLQRWIYYNWARSWQGVNIINAAKGGTTWRSAYPVIRDSITSKSPKVIVLYQGENEYNGYNLRADSINKNFVRYYDEVRKQNPYAYIVVVSMMRIPKLQALWSDIDKLNLYYKTKAGSDRLGRYLDIASLYTAPGSDPTVWRPDGIHLNNYTPFLNVLKPTIIDLLNRTEPPVIDSTDTVTRPVKRMFFGSSTPAQIDLSLFPDSVKMIKAGYGGKTWLMLQGLTDTIRRSGITQVFIYSGANDYLAKRTVPQMTTDIQNLIRKIWAEIPGIRVTYVTVHPSDTAFKIIMKDGVTTAAQAIEYTNRNIINWITNYHKDSASVVNSYGSFLLWNPKRLNTQYFKSDKLHLNAAGQQRLANLMLPLIKQ